MLHRGLPSSALRYDLSKLRAKALVEKIPHSRRYRLLPNGYRICLVFLKLFERIYAPLTAGLLRPFPADNKLQKQRLSQLDRLYQRVTHAVDDLVQAVGLKAGIDASSRSSFRRAARSTAAAGATARWLEMPILRGQIESGSSPQATTQSPRLG